MNPVLSALLWLVVTPIALAVSMLPRSLELALGPWLGRFFLIVDPKRRRIAEENIRRCLPELSAAQRNELIRANYRHYGILALELLHMFSPIPGHWRRYTRKVSTVANFENWQKAHDKGKGVLFLSVHMGNWELMVGAGSMVGMMPTMATRRLKPDWLHKKIESSRLSVGVGAAYLPDTVKILVRALKKGESMGFVLDQYAPPPMGIPAKFFGIEVDTLAAVAMFHQRFGAPIVPVWQIRREDGIVEMRVEPELELGETANDIPAATQILVSRVESWIRQCPAQWLWVHRRFKNLKTPVAS